MMSRPGCVGVGVRLVRRGSYIQIDRACFDDKILACLIEPDPSAPTDAPTIEYETKPGWALKEAGYLLPKLIHKLRCIPLALNRPASILN